MNKVVYRFLRKLIIENDKKHTIKLLENDLPLKEIEKHKEISELEIKCKILEEKKDLFTKEEYDRYLNIISLKKILEK